MPGAATAINLVQALQLKLEIKFFYIGPMSDTDRMEFSRYFKVKKFPNIQARAWRCCYNQGLYLGRLNSVPLHQGPCFWNDLVLLIGLEFFMVASPT